MTDLNEIKPKTLTGIKRLAKQIKKRDGIKHYEALNRAAQQSGYSDFNAARKTLAN